MKASSALTRKQEALIAALLLSPTLAEAAHTAGVGEVTAWRWMRLDGFANAYRTARREAVQHAITRLQAASGEAVTALLAIVKDRTAPYPPRVTAARTILEMTLRAQELEDIHQRIAALEAAGKVPHAP